MTYILIDRVSVCTMRSAVPFACGLYAMVTRCFLSRDPIERSEEIGHKFWLAIMTYCLTRTESSKNAFLVIFRDRLCRSGRSCFRDHILRK